MSGGGGPAAAPRLAVAGFMGAGKTTVARELASLLACPAVDLDELVTERTGRTPQQLIDGEGEAAFREAETEALAAALAAPGARVIALGGGTWALARNRALVEAAGYTSVWLDVLFELCWSRIACGDSRPLARDRVRAERLFAERREFYRLAQLHVSAREGRSPAELAAEIARALRAPGGNTEGA